MKLKVLAIGLGIIIIGLIIAVIWPNPTAEPVATFTNSYPDLIQVDSLQPNDEITSPLTVTGKARGTWYFEGSFPVSIEDANGQVWTGGVPAQAQDEWMTEEFVPFTVTISFWQPETKTGFLVLKNDNPSGDPARDKVVRIPVRFGDFPRADFGKPFTLQRQQSVLLPDDLRVSLNDIEDSRCKPDVQCIWAGELAPLLLVERRGKQPAPPTEVRLGTSAGRKITYYDTYSFELVSTTETAATVISQRHTKPSGEKVDYLGNNGISAYIHIGPMCPVEKNPPDPACADKPVSAQVIFKDIAGKAVGEADSSEQGHVRIALPPGPYSIEVVPYFQKPLSCSSKNVEVRENQFLELDIACDSGIR